MGKSQLISIGGISPFTRTCAVRQVAVSRLTNYAAGAAMVQIRQGNEPTDMQAMKIGWLETTSQEEKLETAKLKGEEKKKNPVKKKITRPYRSYKIIMGKCMVRGHK